MYFGKTYHKTTTFLKNRANMASSIARGDVTRRRDVILHLERDRADVVTSVGGDGLNVSRFRFF